MLMVNIYNDLTKYSILLLRGIGYTSHLISHIQLYITFTFHSYYTYTHTHISGKYVCGYFIDGNCKSDFG